MQVDNKSKPPPVGHVHLAAPWIPNVCMVQSSWSPISPTRSVRPKNPEAPCRKCFAGGVGTETHRPVSTMRSLVSAMTSRRPCLPNRPCHESKSTPLFSNSTSETHIPTKLSCERCRLWRMYPPSTPPSGWQALQFYLWLQWRCPNAGDLQNKTTTFAGFLRPSAAHP